VAVAEVIGSASANAPATASLNANDFISFAFDVRVSRTFKAGAREEFQSVP
jgi:hypothetical protein